MSIIKFTVLTLAGALNKVNSTAELRVGKDQTAKVVMEGYIGAPRTKNDAGDYVTSAFGRLPVQAALVGEGEKQRLVLDIAGGLRGVLFKNTKKSGDKDPDYTGNVECGDETYGLFGRKVKSENGEFISLSSTEAQAKTSSGNGGGKSGSQAPDDHSYDHSSEIPF